MNSIVERLQDFMVQEVKSCSMDFEALHHYTFTGCGEEQWQSIIIWQRVLKSCNL